MGAGAVRTLGVGVVAALGALTSCDALESQRPPLTIVEAHPPAGAAGAGGGTGGEQPTPAPTPEPAPSAPPAGACWTEQLPLEPQPPAPQLAVDEACRRATSATSWTFPTTSTGTASQKFDSHNGDVVGRWVACGQSKLRGQPVAAVEFGGNLRWRALTHDSSGALVPATPAQGGYFYLLGSGQLNVTGEGPDTGFWVAFAKFADGSRDVLALEDTSNGNRSLFARTDASATNGDDNLPSISNGRCSMVGDWDVPANTQTPEAPASTWSFDARGNFVVQPRGAVTCDAHPMYGTYRVATGWFQITSNWNLGLCDWTSTGGWPATFDGSCNSLTLTRQWDNCTGGRGYLNGNPTTLTRRL